MTRNGEMAVRFDNSPIGEIGIVSRIGVDLGVGVDVPVRYMVEKCLALGRGA